MITLGGSPTGVRAPPVTEEMFLHHLQILNKNDRFSITEFAQLAQRETSIRKDSYQRNPKYLGYLADFLRNSEICEVERKKKVFYG